MNWAVRVGCLLAALSVLFGAFGAHSLKAVLTPERLQTWETAVRYQMFASIGLQLSGASRPGAPLLLAGCLIFSGSLYLMCLTDQRWLGAVTPLGGIAMIAGWISLALRRSHD